MSDIINLRRERKRRERSAAAEEAARNRSRFGRSKGETQKTDAVLDLAARRLDGHRLVEEKPAGDPSSDA